MFIRAKLVYLVVSFLFFCHVSFSLNIAVAGGGGVNSYASLVMAVKFAEQVGKPFNQLFDQFWAISGGTIPATLLMHGKENPLELFKTQMGRAFPQKLSFIMDPQDVCGERRANFEKVLREYFGDLGFAKEKKNTCVIIGSAEGTPVYFCDPDFEGLNRSCLRCLDGTSYVDAIAASSGFSTALEFGAEQRISLNLFQPKKMTLAGKMEKMVFDGAHCCVKNNDGYNLDGVAPTPLVIEYLKGIPGDHHVVVFDNGGPINAEFRKSIKVNEEGMATIRTAHGDKIRLYIVTVEVENFDFNSVNTAPEHLTYLEYQVNEAISKSSIVAFVAAKSLFDSKGSDSTDNLRNVERH